MPSNTTDYREFVGQIGEACGGGTILEVTFRGQQRSIMGRRHLEPQAALSSWDLGTQSRKIDCCWGIVTVS